MSYRTTMKVGAMAMLIMITVLLAVAAMAASLTCTLDASGKTTVNVTNLCDHFVLWKTGTSSFQVVCPGSVPPVGAIELREYYNFKIFGGTTH